MTHLTGIALALAAFTAWLAAAAVASSISLPALPAQGATPRKPAQAEPEDVIARVEAAPAVDGLLDDAVWQGAADLVAFEQTRPQPGAEPSRRTLLKFASDGQKLFIAVRAFDPEPGRIVARSLQRDGLGSDDQVVVVIDVQSRRPTKRCS
jgi:hypothetical protein